MEAIYKLGFWPGYGLVEAQAQDKAEAEAKQTNDERRRAKEVLLSNFCSPSSVKTKGLPVFLEALFVLAGGVNAA